MKAAPIQLQQLSFRRVSVEVNEADLTQGDSDQAEPNLTFDRCNIVTHVHFTPLQQDDKKSPAFLVTLRVVVDDKSSGDDTECNASPYLLDIEAGAIIDLAKGAEKLPDIEDIVLVNGTSMLWSAIREQVCNLTARMPLGTATLPTVHFQDLREQKSESVSVQSKPAKPRVTRSRTKTPL